MAVVVGTAAAVVVAWELKQRRRRRQRECNKPIGLEWQNNNLARGLHFPVHSFTDYDVKMPV